MVYQRFEISRWQSMRLSTILSIKKKNTPATHRCVGFRLISYICEYRQCHVRRLYEPDGRRTFEEHKWTIFTVVESKLLFASINCKALNANRLCAINRQPLSLDVSPFYLWNCSFHLFWVFFWKLLANEHNSNTLSSIIF